MSTIHSLAYYQQIIPFLYEVLGEDSEVILHDIQNPNASIIAIAGNLSQRKVGGPLTDIALQHLQNKTYLTSPHVTNYKSYTTSGKICRSSSYFIKNEEQKLIGMLCINILISDLMDMKKQLDKLIRIDNHMSFSTNEHLGHNVEELMSSLITRTLKDYPADKRQLTPIEKEEIIQSLYDKGVFLLKGAVPVVAQHIELSEPSVYRYLSQIKED